MEQTAASDHLGSPDAAAWPAARQRGAHASCGQRGAPTRGHDDPLTRSFARIEARVQGLPPMAELWARLPARDAVAQLQHREQVLGVATLAWQSVCLLHAILEAVGAPTVIWRHAPSRRAAEKQAILDTRHTQPRVWVQKTVTLRLGAVHVLCTGAGDFALPRSLLAAVAQALDLPTRSLKACQINPPACAPEETLGLLTGMVSPFVAPGRFLHCFHAVLLLTDPDGGDQHEESMLAVSLSPCESLLFPRAHLRVVTHRYAQHAYPALRWLALECPRGPGAPSAPGRAGG